MDVLLYNSTVCRLCGEENEKGSFLYTTDASGQNLSELINAYLPLKVYDDGQLPRTVCPGCAIQVEAAVEFLNLIIKGQKIIRELHQREIDYKKNALKTEVITENIIYEINTNGQVYQVEHPISLQVAGLERPKRKRGRPPKKQKTPEELAAEQEEERERERIKAEAIKEEEPDLQGKRRRKAPNRFREAVQGKELEKILKEEGVIDASESEAEGASKEGAAAAPGDKGGAPAAAEAAAGEPEVIGLVQRGGELLEIVVVKGRKRGRPRGRIAQNECCATCGMQFSSLGRYMAHVAGHVAGNKAGNGSGHVAGGNLQCSCGQPYATRALLAAHQEASGHQGQRVIAAEKEPLPTTTQQTPAQTTNSSNETETVKIPEVQQKSPSIPGSVEPGGEVAGDRSEESSVIDVVNNADEETANQDSVEPPEEGEEPEENPTTARGKPKLKCHICHKLFSNKQSKSLHIKARHAGERPYVCNVCGAAFPYPRSLTLHAIRHRRHDPSRGYACDLCGKVLNHPSSVVYHKEAEHANHQYVCLKCGKGFKHKQLLQRHQLVHSQLRPFTCELCPATFKSKSNLMNHGLLHSGERRHACAACPQRFAHRTSLTLHMRLHAGIKPYKCTECGKTFSQKGNLSEHARTHSGEKPYSCAVCARAFTTSSQRRLHARRHARVPPPPAPARCLLCPRAFPERGALQRHVRRHHRPQATKRSEKQLSLLTTHVLASPEPATPPPLEAEVAAEAEVVAEEEAELVAEGEEERVIYVTYDDDVEGTEFHILDNIEGEEWKLQSSALEEGGVLVSGGLYDEGLAEAEGVTIVEEVDEAEPQHLAVTDSTGNPLHLTLADGSRFAVACSAGALQLVTGGAQLDRRRPEESAGPLDYKVLELCEDDAPAAQYFVV